VGKDKEKQEDYLLWFQTAFFQQGHWPNQMNLFKSLLEYTKYDG